MFFCLAVVGCNDRVCPNGKVVVGDNCVCPEGTVPDRDWCEPVDAGVDAVDAGDAGADGTDAEVDVTVPDASPGAELYGRSTLSCVDLNGDGQVDVTISDPDAEDGRGRLHVYNAGDPDSRVDIRAPSGGSFGSPSHVIGGLPE